MCGVETKREGGEAGTARELLEVDEGDERTSGSSTDSFDPGWSSSRCVGVSWSESGSLCRDGKGRKKARRGSLNTLFHTEGCHQR